MGGVADMAPTLERQQQLQEELYALLARRRLTVLEHAAWLGSTDDAVDSSSRAQPELERIERRIAELRLVLDRDGRGDADDRMPGATGVGARVTVRWDDGAEETYTLVEPVASDPRRGWISTESPVGQSLLGRRPGERVTVAAPGGQSRLVVLTVA